ncbi:unnamed protein product [Macrosiphum euphorbiae]|uniref:FLYWCH-type domain-containing protein n=1 Tax=Macrosiphum euphorbiae TaxID=13131 RepID=A0AAV0WSY2_9HEMI|nr:unnamed protein product [Macrosiphum euphorbiae]
MSVLQYITSQRGKKLLVYNNYIHRQDRRDENKIIWRCNGNQKCSGRVHVSENDIVLKYVDHSHLSDVAKIQAKKTVEGMKTLAKENSLTTRAILGEGSSQVIIQ